MPVSIIIVYYCRQWRREEKGRERQGFSEVSDEGSRLEEEKLAPLSDKDGGYGGYGEYGY